MEFEPVCFVRTDDDGFFEFTSRVDGEPIYSAATVEQLVRERDSLETDLAKYIADYSAQHEQLAEAIKQSEFWQQKAIEMGLEGLTKVQQEIEYDLNKCPNCGGPADNGHDRRYPPNPYYCTKCEDK